MSNRGRPPQGPKLVEGLEGSAEAKQRLALILETLTGERTVAQACGALGIGESRFHELRKEVLQAATAAAEPRPLGRPVAPQPTAAEEANATLREQLTDTKIKLEASLIREEIALVMPQLLKPRREDKKKPLRSPDSTSLRPGASPGTPPSSGASGGTTT